MCGMMLTSTVVPVVVHADEINIQEKQKVSMTIKFNSSWADVKDVEISGIVGEQVDITKYLPEGYELVYDNEKIITLSSDDNQTQYRLVQGKLHDESIQFIEKSSNKVVGNSKVSVRERDRIELKKYLPDGYTFEDDRNSAIYAGLKSTNHKVNVESLKTKKYTTTLELVDIDNNRVDSGTRVSGLMGEKIKLDHTLISDEFKILGDKFIIIDGNHTTKVLVEKLPNKNSIEFFAPDGREIFAFGPTEVWGKIGEETLIPNHILPKGYTLGEKNSIIIDENKSVPHKIYLKPLTGKLKLEFFDLVSRKKIYEKQINTTSGNRVHLSFRDIPNGYYFSDERERYKNLEFEFNAIVSDEVKRIFLTKNTTNESLLPESVKTYFSISTYPNGSNVSLYNSFGKKSNRMLSPNSDWNSDRVGLLNGETYFRVSTDEWVRVKDVYEYKGSTRIASTNKDKTTKLYSVDGKLSNRMLSPSTEWMTDKSAFIDGIKYYRVSTNEWVSENDVNLRDR